MSGKIPHNFKVTYSGLILVTYICQNDTTWEDGYDNS
jgi:hypothetical protein